MWALKKLKYIAKYIKIYFYLNKNEHKQSFEANYFTKRCF